MRKNRLSSTQNGFTMMTLDDDATMTAALKAYFEASGFEVDDENDPLRALDRLKQKKYDILLLDFLMSPISGEEVVSRLRKFDQDVFIILLTGHKELAPPLNTIRALDIQGYYEKSERFDQLELLVESCMKAIRQMRVIRAYRDGLQNVLDASQAITRLGAMEDMLSRVLSHALPLAEAEDGFITLSRAGEPQHFLGAGALASRDAGEQLAPGGERALQENKAVQESAMVFLPMRGAEGQALGVIVLRPGRPLSQDALRLLTLYGKQAAAACENALLHGELSSAYDRLNEGYLNIISALRQAVDAKDLYTRGHSDRTSYYSELLAKEMGCDDAAVERVRVAGLFHDVGKLAVKDEILTKNGGLSATEYEEIKAHPERGARILSSLTMFSGLENVVRAHHERWDGKGYPDGLAGENIPLEARIITICDAYDAMTSRRAYAALFSPDEALAELESGRGSQFDARLVNVFVKLVRERGEALREALASTFGEES